MDKSTNKKIFIIIVSVLVFLSVSIICSYIVDRYRGSIVSPDNVIVRTLNIIDNNRMEISFANYNSMCVMKKCEIEIFQEEMNIIVYTTSCLSPDSKPWDESQIDIGLSEKIQRVYIKGDFNDHRILIWERQ